ncbi:MAG: hypothetical protein WB994_02495 [Candidatus Acidiferrum sp.]
MAHLSIRIPDADLAWLKAEAARQGRDVSFILRELIHRAYDVTTSPLTADAGELAKSLDKVALLRVLVLGARRGQFLVEPDGKGFDNIQLWIDADLITFPDVKTVEPIPAPLLSPPIRETPLDLRLNIMAYSTETPESGLNPAGSLPVPSKCGICGERFPSKAAKKRHVKKDHPTPKSEDPK